MKVTLFSGTPMPSNYIVWAAKRCYSTAPAEEIWDEVVNCMSDDKKAAFILKLAKSGHLTPFEHCHYTFSIEDISRACSHQIVRHRLFSFDQLSHRYTTHPDLVHPEFLCDLATKNPDLYNKALALAGDSVCLYKQLQDNGVKGEDARMFLPHMLSTSLVMSGNGRMWIEMLNKRLCRRAQAEFREIALEVFAQLHTLDPLVFNEEIIGPPCLRLGYCPEFQSCGNPVEHLLEE